MSDLDSKREADDLRREIVRYQELIERGLAPDDTRAALEAIYRADARLRELKSKGPMPL